MSNYCKLRNYKTGLVFFYKQRVKSENLHGSVQCATYCSIFSTSVCNLFIMSYDRTLLYVSQTHIVSHRKNIIT